MGGQNKGWDVAGTIFECQQSTKTSFVDLEVESGVTGVRGLSCDENREEYRILICMKSMIFRLPRQDPSRSVDTNCVEQ